MGLFGKSKDDGGGSNQAIASLKSKEIQADILIQSIDDGIVVTDPKGLISIMNASAARMTEWSAEEAANIDARIVLKLLADEKTSQAITDADHPFAQVISTKQPFSQTLQLISRNNSRLYISLVISPIILPGSQELTGTIAVIRDISKQRGEEQRGADFISTASHEMRTPVAAIEGYLALALNDKVSSIDAKARDYLEKAHASTKHLGQLFQDLLTSAKAEDGRLTSHPVVVEMGTFTEQLTGDLRFGAEKKNLEVEFIHGTAAPIDHTKETVDATTTVGKTVMPLYYAKVDPDRIREVITNVFDNAVKYTETGKVSIGITGNDNVVQIRVQDTGPGIPATDLPHLFQKFYRVDNSATRSIGGTGLGLFICKAIVELYDGVIWAESKVGEGSIFYINLPRLTAQQAAHLQAQEKPQSTLGQP